MDKENLLVLRKKRVFAILLTTFVVLGLAVILLTLSCFLVGQRENARHERCEMNLKELYAAFVEYADANGSFPPAFTQNSDGQKLHSWRVLILPYIGEEDLYCQIRLNEPWNSEWNRQFWTKTPNVYRCASTPVSENETSEEKAQKCAYSCVLGANTPFPDDGTAVAPKSIIDGGTNTILLVERKTPTNWMDPDSEITVEEALEENKLPITERKNFGSWHGSGECVVFCDGSKRFLSEKIDNSVLALLFGIDDSKDLPNVKNENAGLKKYVDSITQENQTLTNETSQESKNN